MYYDTGDRVITTVDVGTNGGSSYTRPSSVPSRSDTVLVTSQTYDDAGRVATRTDPRGIESRTTYDDLGRTIKTIEAYTDGTPSNADDKTTEYTYDGAGHMLTLKALLTGGAYQQTQFVYGVSTSSGSDLNSNDILSATKYPNKTTGTASDSEKETYTVNILGERKTLTDRNGTVHTYTYDVLGRTRADAITTLASGVDGAVRRLETAFDSAGRPYLYTSYDASSGGSIVNQVQQGYNGLGQLITEYQSHSGAVNTSTTPKVQYAYSEMSSGANHSRQTIMTYPNGRVITSNYASGLDSTISRLTSLSDTSGTLESYSYLGLGAVVIRSHPQPGVDLTYVKQTGESNGDAGDPYTGLDRFGRIVDQRWRKTSDGSHTDRFKYAYDRDGNRLYRTNELNHSFDELYHANGATAGYDSLNQLTDFRRGTLTDTNSDGILDTVSTASRTQSWSFDALGNWSSDTTDGTTETRSHNAQNQITSISGKTTPAYDANGNMTGDENGKTLVYDAWNRMVAYKNGSTTLASHQYDALKRRVVENEGTAVDMYFSSAWQVLEERESGTAVRQYVWSPVYVDAMIERDRDADNNSGNGMEERLLAQHDANWNITTLETASATTERYGYFPYGEISFFDSNWAGQSDSNYSWNYRFQGGRSTSSTRFTEFRHRSLLPSLGRWTIVDPSNFSAGDDNLYRFLFNTPTNATDPLGLNFVPQLKVEPVEDAGPTRGSFGSFLWGINWRLSAISGKGGFVLQHLIITTPDPITFQDGNPANITLMQSTLQKIEPKDWWEAWEVNPQTDTAADKHLSQFPPRGNAKLSKLWVENTGIELPKANAKAHDWYYLPGARAEPPTNFSKGSIVFYGRAFFVECSPDVEILKKYGFGYGKAKGSISLLSVTDKEFSPKISQFLSSVKGHYSHEIEHSLKRTWSFEDPKGTISTVP